jgi:hypothetical protein
LQNVLDVLMSVESPHLSFGVCVTSSMQRQEFMVSVPFPFAVWMDFTASTGKRVSTREAWHGITRMLASRQQSCDPMHHHPRVQDSVGK